ncbi:hypothetical protein DPMN_084705 [Dreissena polymorpha]|uniref:UV excision repair protein RAD23 n=1 Tax=Dreissena polymorpha TaxID=45954 RepID=A0A9D3YEU0_DREPO|nr:hypothetical protein DPMN_084705 [Dreissena polymorpha]
MIVTLKTLQQQTFKVEVDPEQTVKELKQKVEKEKGADAFPAAGQKLIYAGKILDDEKPVGFYKIEEKNFVVVMVTKPKPAADSTVIASVPTPAAPTRAAPAPSPQPAPPSAVEPTKTESVSEPPSNTSSSTDASSDPSVSESNLTQASDTTASGSDISTASAESALVTGQMYEDAVANIVAMGFARSEVQRAMRASFNNPDRAVEYLFNGIPELPREEPPPAPTGDAPTPPRPAAPVAAPAAGTGARTGAPPASGTASAGSPGQLTGPPPGAQLSGEETLAFLRNQPQFQHMRNLLQQNPSLLPELLQQIGRSNPTLLQLISQNQEQFISMLNEQGGESVAGGQGRTPGEGVIHVTQEEKEAIDRVGNLGIDSVGDQSIDR